MGGLREVFRGESRIDFVGRSRLWATISGIVLVGSAIGAFLSPGLELSLEFEGGTKLSAPIEGDPVTVADVEETLAPFELGEIQVQIVSGGDLCSTGCIEVRSQRVEPDKLEEVRLAVAELAGLEEEDGSPALGEVDVTDVGPSWGKQVSRKALRALLVFLVLVTIYISLRFEPKMAAGALVALAHDLLATAGIYAFTGLTVSPATVVALLTLMGFSLYDTVVVFDRVSENAAGIGARESYGAMVNRSINEVLVRSINTSVSSILPVGGLLFVGVFLFGADTLKDLAVAMFIGTAVSIYSSIFVAAPVLAALKEREPRFKALKGKVLVPSTTGGAEAAVRAPDAPVATPSGRHIKPQRKKGRR